MAPIESFRLNRILKRRRPDAGFVFGVPGEPWLAPWRLADRTCGWLGVGFGQLGFGVRGIVNGVGGLLVTRVVYALVGSGVWVWRLGEGKEGSGLPVVAA